MKTTLTKKSRRELVGFYRDELRRLTELLISPAILESARPRYGILLAQTEEILARLDRNAAKWARREIRAVYGMNLDFVDAFLRSRGLRAATQLEESLALIHEDAIKRLLLDETGGLIPRLRQSTQGLRAGVGSFVRDRRGAFRQLRAVQRTVAEGILEGRAARETRNKIMDAMVRGKPAHSLGLERIGATTATGGIRSILEAPYLRIGGGRRMHIFDHVNSVAFTIENQARTEARNNRVRERGIDLVQVTPNPPLTPDACSLYAGRVFALTDEAAARTGYPLYSRIPGGGMPLHPFCSHSTLPFSELFVDEEEKNLAEKSGAKGIPTEKGVPSAILDVEFKDAQKYLKEKGGLEFAFRQNPQLAKGPVSSLADQSVRDAANAANAARP